MTSLLDAVVLPQGWRFIPFGRLVERSREADRPDLPPLSVFLDEGVVPRTARSDNFNQLGSDMAKYLVVRPGDVVFNKLRTWQGGLGVSHYKGLVSPAYFVCRPSPLVDSQYLHYLLRSTPYLAELTRVSKFMPPSQFDILWDDLRVIPILTPQIETQRQISDFLDAAIAHIDTIISKKRHLIELLDEQDRRTIDDLFEDVLSNRLIRLGYVADVRSGVTLGGKHPRAAREVTVPYLRVANVQHDRLDLNKVKTITVDMATAQRTMLRSGDVLMTEGGDIDKLGRGTVWQGELNPCLHQNHVFAVRVRTRDLLPEFLALVTRTTHARRYFEMTGVRSTNLASTSASKVSDFRIPYPSRDVQLSLVNQYQRKWDALDRARVALNRQLDLLAERRNALITAVVTGERPIPAVAA